MKNIKLILTVIILIILNLFIFTNIAFNIKYKALIANYNQLSNDYKELEEKYIAQEVMLKEAIENRVFKEYTFKEKIVDILKIDEFVENIKSLSIKDIFKNLEVSVFK